MKTQYYTATSLDGFIADADQSLDWLDRLGHPEPSSYPAFIRGVGAVAMGSTTYEWVLRHLERSGEAWPYEKPTWVFSSRDLRVPAGAGVRVVRGDVRPVHRDMVEAAAGGNVWIAGGGDLVGQFHDAGLLDELIVTIASVTLGSGAPLLPRRIVDPPLRLVSATALGDAFVELRYEVVGGVG